MQYAHVAASNLGLYSVWLFTLKCWTEEKPFVTFCQSVSLAARPDCFGNHALEGKSVRLKMLPALQPLIRLSLPVHFLEDILNLSVLYCFLLLSSFPLLPLSPPCVLPRLLASVSAVAWASGRGGC